MPEATDLLRQAQELLARQRDLENRWRCDRADCDGMPHEGWTHKHARGSQREPDDYEVWLIKTGRGWGKTRTGAETVKGWGTGRRRHIAVIGKTDRETRNIAFEGPGGLLSVIKPEQVKQYARTAGDTSITLTNGTTFRGFSAERPESLRGYAFDGAWCDEFGSWSPITAMDCWDNLWFTLREAAHPKVIVTTTPRTNSHLRQVLDTADVVTHGHTRENMANLSRAAVRALERRYGDTRIGRQELAGELIEDIDGALWTMALIDDNRVLEVPDFLYRVVVAIDPATTTTGDETGIVVVGAAGDRSWPHLYVLEDASGRYTPDAWARRAVSLHDKYRADAIIAEVNQGGDMVESVLRQVAPPGVHVRKVTATRGKYLRAEPVVALYEQGRGHHIDGVDLTRLEEQMTTWTMDSRESPDRLDALVWGATDLLRFGAATIHTPVNLRIVR